MRYIYIKIVTAVALFVCFMTALLTVQEHVIFYQEQHNLFLYSGQYINETFHSKGLMGVLGSFMVQFYYLPWLGASIVSFLLTGIYLFIESLIKRLTGCRDIFQVGVIAAVSLYYTLDGLDETPAWVLLAFIAIFAVWMLTMPMRRKEKNVETLKIWQIILAFVLPIIYINAGLWLEMRDYNRPERAMILADKAAKEENWDKVLEITERYLDTGRSNKLMLYLRNIALAKRGELIDRLFDYPQNFGAESLAFPWRGNSSETEYGHLVHEVTGDINTAHQWAFESMTVWGETSPHLRDLARYNVALGRPKVAQKFVNKLRQSLFYKKDADKIKRQIEGKEKLDLRYVNSDSVTVKWINVMDFRPNVLQNYLIDPKNEMARQYVEAAMLMNGDLRNLVQLLNKEDLLKRPVKEAVLIYSLDPQATPLSEFGIEVDPATGKDFASFYEMLRSPSSIGLENAYGRSFWYYFHVLKPRQKNENQDK